MTYITRRDVLKWTALHGSGIWQLARPRQDDQRRFNLSLSERSLGEAIRSREVDHLDVPRIASQELGIKAVDYDTSLFHDQCRDEAYLSEMNKRAADFGVRHILLIVEQQGRLGAEKSDDRRQAVERHLAMIDTAVALGCRGICVRAVGEGTPGELAKRMVQSLRELSERGQERKIHILVSNRSSPAHSPDWLLKVIEEVDSTRCGVIPAFDGLVGENRFQDLRRVMKRAGGVCASVSRHAEDVAVSDEDFRRKIEIISQVDYRGYVSLEFLGPKEAAMAGLKELRDLIQSIHQSDQ